MVRRYQNTVAGEIARFEGYVAKFMGDGVLAYFGWPKAHEDEPGSAVRAAMAAVTAVQDLRTNDGEVLAARAGIATGLVVVGDLIGEGAAQEAAVVGNSPNIAARLQELANPGQVVIAASTQRLVQASFDLAPLGPRSVKGLAEPIPAFAVLGEKTSGSRFEARWEGVSSPWLGTRPDCPAARTLRAGTRRRRPVPPPGGRSRNWQVAYRPRPARRRGRH